ncbi:MAG: phosphoenolpyruvate--protein phosphotransferase [Fusobacteriaceae bacterium]
MLEIKGKTACEGVVIGEVFIHKPKEFNVEKKTIEPSKIEEEIVRWKKSMEKSKEDIRRLKQSLKNKLKKKELDILMAHIVMLDDPMYIKDIEKIMRAENANAEYAVKKISDKYFNLFEQLEDPVYNQRKSDVKDISERILENLVNDKKHKKDMSGKIFVAQEMLPSELLDSIHENIVFKGIILENGGETSHVAILAKSLGIPMLMGINNVLYQKFPENEEIILDARKKFEKIIISPDSKTVADYKILKKNIQLEKEEQEKSLNLPCETKDGVKISLKINVAGMIDLLDIEKNKADGVGLFRTELMYMESTEFLKEEQQIEIYEELIGNIAKEKEVVIRTLDIGADKKLSYYEMKEESNPFLGIRGIRHSLLNTEILKIQLRAILRVAYGKKIKIMYPMITKIKELLDVKEILKQCKDELKNEGIPYNENIKEGIMVEVPSVSLMAEQFSKHVDFFSIGTNDLTQYILATDRLSEDLADFYDPYDPSVLKAISFVADAAKKNNKNVSVCGEMAGEEMGIVAFLSLGIYDLSMVRSSVAKARSVVRKINISELKVIREEILKAENSEEIKKILKGYLKK